MEKGDQVVVVMAYNNVFPWQSATKWGGVLLSAPRGPGDTYRIRVQCADDRYDGREISLNGNGVNFIGIYRSEESGG